LNLGEHETNISSEVHAPDVVYRGLSLRPS
jgi:hypothetical protein